MKIAEIVLSVIALLVCVLGILKVMPNVVSIPIMLFALASLLVLRGIEFKRKSDKSGFILTFSAAAVVYIALIYNLFAG